MPPARDADQAPYDNNRVPLAVTPYTTNAIRNAAHAIIIELPASRPVQRSGRGRLSSDANPSRASRSAGDPTPTSTNTVRGMLAMSNVISELPFARPTMAALARSPPEAGTRAFPG